MQNIKGSLVRLIISILCLSILLISVNSVSQAANEFIYLSNDLYLEEVEEDIYMVIHNFPWPANSLLVMLSPTDYVLIDTPYTPEATNAVIDWARRKNEDCNIIEINTGFHIDNLGGNEYLASQNIPIYGADLTLQLLEEKCEETRTQLLGWLSSPSNKYYHERYKNISFTKPNHLFDIYKGLILEVGDEIIEIYYPGVSHSPDNVVVYFKNRQILFGGCMIKSVNSPDLGFTGDAEISEWFTSVEKVLEKYSESRIVIPGHGDWGGIDLIERTLQLLEIELDY